MIERILVGTAAEDESDATLRLAAELAARHDAELHLLRLEPLLDARQVFDPDGVPPRSSPDHGLRRSYPGLRLRTTEVRGNPVRTVCAVARDEQPDLIVVGHGRGRRGGRALLSRRASNALVERAPCAVLLVAS
jgi:nucleotide-binding universal stress UspA family protein